MRSSSDINDDGSWVFTPCCQNTPSPIDLSYPQEYRIAGISVLGAEYTDVQAIKLFSSLQIGAPVTIPGEDIARAITNLWDQDLFADISIEVAEIRGADIYLVIRVEELPRLTRYSIAGISRSEQETIRGKIDLLTGRIVNENVIAIADKRIRNHYIEKGYFDVEVSIVQQVDSSFENGTMVRVNIDKGEKVKIDLITLEGVTEFEADKLKRKLKDTKEKKWWRFYKPSKYLKSAFETDQELLIAEYNMAGYRNARITNDSLYRTDDGLVGLVVNIDEGNKFYFRDITFAGNTKYRTTQLDSILGINKGMYITFKTLKLESLWILRMDLSSLYQDDGYLTFRAMPIKE